MPRKNPCSLAFASAFRYVSSLPRAARPRLGRSRSHCFSDRSASSALTFSIHPTRSSSVIRPSLEPTSAPWSSSRSASMFTFGIF
eukprot:31566-Pelagococcus_subviridis.AAC.8